MRHLTTTGGLVMTQTPTTFDDLEVAEAHGLVSRSEANGLALFCYTPQTAHERLWDSVTRSARGLIFDVRTRRCVARPFPKFFNLGEMPETQLAALPGEPFVAEEKVDGSLGILFHHAGRWNVSTKGSFDSEQARFAAEELLPRLRIPSAFEPFTFLAEIVYPENRIVVDYGVERSLRLLAIIETDSGRELSHEYVDRASYRFGFRKVRRERRRLDGLDFEENAEGYVLRFDGGLRVKVKSPRYVEVHRLLNYRSPKRVLELIEAGRYSELAATLPDGLQDQFDDIAGALHTEIDRKELQAQSLYDAAHRLLPDRKAFAMHVKASPVAPLVFALADGKPTRPLAIRLVRKELEAA